MLKKKDLRYNFFLLRVLTALQILPVDFDVKSGTLKIPRSPWKRRFSLGFFTIAAFHSCYINLRLLQVLLYSHNFKRHHLVFHMDLSLASLMIGGWYLACFVRYPGTFVAVYNEIFLVSGGTDGAQVSQAARKARSRQEWLALMMPTIHFITVLFVLLIFTYDRTMAFLLFSILPKSYSTPQWLRLLFCEEAFFLFFMASNGCILLNTQLIFFVNLTGSLKRLAYSPVLYTDRMAEVAYNKLRKIQLQVNLFNEINRFIIFSFKLFCITMCTFNGYSMFAHFSTDPVFGSVYYVVFALSCMLYSILYERAFAIPMMGRLAKLTVLLRSGTKISMPGFKRQTKMRLRSIPAMGIQVGHFHTFERVALPLFVDYVLRNVMGLLVMHLRN